MKKWTVWSWTTAMLPIIAMILLAFVDLTFASPPSSTPPAAPKATAQIASEAYAIESSVKANAGRKTTYTDDGTGSPVITGSPPQSSSTVSLPVLGDCSSNSDEYVVGHGASLMCDGNDATYGQPLWNSGTFPKLIRFNLNGAWQLSSVAVHWGLYRCAGSLEVLIGASTWVAMNNFSDPGNGNTVTYTINPTITTAYRLNIPANDGTCIFYVIVYETFPLGKQVGGDIWQDSTWTNVNITLLGPMVARLRTNNTAIHLTITNSYINGGSLDAAFYTDDQTMASVFVWDATTAFTLTITDSTLKNFNTLLTHKNLGGSFRVGASVLKLSNVTMTNFSTALRPQGSVERLLFGSATRDSTFSTWNRGDAAVCALRQYINQGDNNGGFMSVIQNRFNGAGTFTGCAVGNDVRLARDNYFEGGFTQLIFGSDFEHGTVASYTGEYVNWSHNFANDSLHTVFGFYGTGVGYFSNHLPSTAYATIAGNYINSSRYIPIQTSGNATGLRILGNYLRGPSPWPGGTPTFELAMLIGGQDHDVLVNGNYLWEMNDTHISGINIGLFAYRITISNNVLYDVGSNFIRVGGLGLKYKNETGIEKSDYSWKGMSILIRDNYLAGATTGDRAILVDSGYVRFQGNTIANGPTAGMFDLVDGWNCHPGRPGFTSECSYVWVDWVDGYPDVPSIRFPASSATNETYFWVRSMRTGILRSSLTTSFSIAMTTSAPTHFGLLAARCIWPDSNDGDHTTDAEILAWGESACNPVQDTTSFAFGGYGVTYIADEPEQWYNKTLTVSFSPVTGTVSGTAEMEVTETGFGVNLANVNRQWTILQGHSYDVVPPIISLGQIVDWTRLLVFFALITLGLMGAFAIKKRRG